MLESSPTSCPEQWLPEATGDLFAPPHVSSRSFDAGVAKELLLPRRSHSAFWLGGRAVFSLCSWHLKTILPFSGFPSETSLFLPLTWGSPSWCWVCCTLVCFFRMILMERFNPVYFPMRGWLVLAFSRGFSSSLRLTSSPASCDFTHWMWYEHLLFKPGPLCKMVFVTSSYYFYYYYYHYFIYLFIYLDKFFMQSS